MMKLSTSFEIHDWYLNFICSGERNYRNAPKFQGVFLYFVFVSKIFKIDLLNDLNS